MTWPQRLTARRTVAVVFVSLVVIGGFGAVVFENYGAVNSQAGHSGNDLEFQNYGEQPAKVSITLVDVQTNEGVFETSFTLGTAGKEGHNSLDWPSMTPGKKRLTVVVGENQSNSYEFDVEKDGDGPNLTVTITKDEIDFGTESSGL